MAPRVPERKPAQGGNAVWLYLQQKKIASSKEKEKRGKERREVKREKKGLDEGDSTTGSSSHLDASKLPASGYVTCRP